MGTIEIEFAPHWVNAALVRALARPFITIDGVEHRQSWTASSTYALEPGSHDLTAFIRYRGTRAALGTGRRTVSIDAGEHVSLRARNGWANHMPFELELRLTPTRDV
ncbi:hypothetical protein CH275_24490 [Rhodococcus sp. 06-235-1A]|uniref:hypothetical protein n=1 Tax=Rhodococcus sp. 06-235-1A TaxID=2022508 RepID=UPI000B9B69C4|nr:hypothetical protein [Rhodococcus sp. 06-235-1A]OZC97315.1 hypothetical protein CH275_24490 [Rhodococcus sp. 06-235-1A]